MTPRRRAPRLWAHTGVGFVERTYLLAKAGRGNGRWNGGQLEVTQDAGHHRLLGDSSDDASCATAAKRKVARLPPSTQWRKTGGRSQITHATHQSGPVPIRCSRLLFLAIDTLLARCENKRVAKLAIRRQAAGIAHEVDTWQGYERRQLLQEFQRRKLDGCQWY